MRSSNLWYKSAIIYELDLRTFSDSNGDGWGDFGGLIQKLDYIASLGCTCIWLKPFNPSPLRDGGYDVTDYYGVDARVGNPGAFVEFMEEAASRGLAVITELVANHTSIDHPWFVEAASDIDSELRDFYIWRDEPESAEDSPERITFAGDDTSVWQRHEASDQYYLHRFYSHEPDLNNGDGRVQEEMCRILAYYLRLGVSGFRIDAAPYVAEKAAGHPELDGPHDYLRRLRSFATSRRPDVVLMAEADVEPEGLDEYFGDGDEMNLLLNFLLSQYLFLALAEGSADPLHELLDVMPRAPRDAHYANFLRNHDELDLERLSEDQRMVVMESFAPDPDMRIFGRGIRRRVAPMLGGDRRRLRLAHSLLFSMPGTPIIYYGDEIGMGEDLGLEERQPVRTPMQWSSDHNGGFSAASASDLHLPPISEGPFSYSRVNVADQQGQPDSMLNWMRRLINVRKQARPIFSGDWRVLETGDPAVFALGYEHEGEVLATYHNLSAHETTVKLADIGAMSHLVDLFSDDSYDSPKPDSHELSVNARGFRWLEGRRDENQG